MRLVATLVFFLCVHLNAFCKNLSEAPQEAVMLYVSASEKARKSNWPITAEGSNQLLNSMAAARDWIRQWRKGASIGPIEVHVKPGVYFLPETFELGAEDSGTPADRITYQADGAVRFIGGSRLALPTSWKKGEELIIAGPIPPPISPPNGRLDRSWPGFDVIWDSQRLRLTCWPAAPAADKPEAGWAYIESVPTGARDRFICHSISSPIVTDLANAEVHLFSQPEWFDQIIELASYDPITGEVKLRHPASYPLIPGARFCLQNVRTTLNTPGEWWFNASRNEIHLIAPQASTPETEVYVTQLQALLKMHKVSHVTFRGFTWEGSVGDAVQMTDVDDCVFTNNNISLAGGWALIARTNGRLFLNANVINMIGLGGMKLAGGDRQKLISSQITASNNTLSDLGQSLLCYMPAFFLDGVGITVTHNRISHLPHNAIMFAGNNHLIIGNLIEDVCRETNDVGAIYSGRDWSTRGTLIEGNVFRQIAGWHLIPSRTLAPNTALPHYTHGGLAHAIYLDDMLENSVIRDNVFIDIESAAIHLGGGSYHTISRNFFVRVKEALFISERGDFNTARDRLLPYLQEGSPYFSAYPEIKEREAHDPLTPSQLLFLSNHFIDVPLLYDIRLLGTQNIFSKNHFSGTLPAVKAVLKQDQARKPLTSWAEWQAADFDGDAVLESKLSREEQQEMDKITSEAGPRNPKAIKP